MQERELPVAEWCRLQGTEAERLWPLVNPENTRFIVVEDGGRIIGCWAMLRTVHAECLWTAPDRRGEAGIPLRLFRGMKAIAAEWGVGHVITGSQSEHVTDLIQRFGGKPMPCESFVLPVVMKNQRRAEKDRALGRHFHEQLEALVVDGLHADDPDHDEAVGRAIRTAVDEGEPEAALDAYNHWAFAAGYAPIRYLGTVDGRLRADIVTAKIEVDRDHVVRVMEEGACRQQQLQR